ncbi:MAG: hypothetical protein M9949_14315 [Candidatus Kapabacteria bacterium]|nr:hypothetical protein [Candidatus Kapabacteria bacterium]
MYDEISIINQIADKKAKASVIMLFLVEYGGWLQHLNSVGFTWGADGKERGANHEANKTRAHIKELKKELLKLIV